VNRLSRPAPLLGVAVAVTAVAAVTGVNYGLRLIAPAVSTGVVYLLAVLLVSTYWGLWLGLVTGLLSAAAFNFFHLPPENTFHLANGENWVALGVFLVAATVTSTLAEAARSRAREAEQRRLEADLSAEMARLLLGGTSIEEALPTLGQRLARSFGLSSVSVELSCIDSDLRRRALPLVVEGDRAGTVLVPRDADPAALAALQERVMPALETLVSAARRREQLEAQVIETEALRRSNVVQRAVLRSVSHDLRSPLTAITTAAGGLQSETLSSDARDELAAVIAQESARLTRLVENLLDLSRLQAGSAEPQRDWCSVDEVVRAALESVTTPPGGFDIALDQGPSMLNADAVQLERALANVLDNAARYAGDEPVTVRARTAGSTLTLRVIDRGPGIPKEELERVFEPFHRAENRPGAGSGLGLAIARGFVEANGGRLRAESLPGQGTTFVFQLPVPDAAPTAATGRSAP
jgi:two-component system sensor histidine kinase KdpD